MMMRIGLIAGSGQFPIIFSKEARSKGFAVYAVAHNNETDPTLRDYVDAIEWIYLGQINRIIKFFKKSKIDQAVMIGGITKTKMIIARMKHTHDDGILRSFVKVLEKEGIHIQDSTFLLPNILAQEGCWTKRKPSRTEKADIELGWKLAKEIGRLDIGQCVVVGG
ncbi:MAG: UDP-2,3-diacylglucosamine diphosphatase LpxI, partial [Deltaproteobacteria bacterium]|nr:UDP-2,3-diacylglucosamine diphosphatase LpxI [Deltaproteobacteria bacterium]